MNCVELILSRNFYFQVNQQKAFYRSSVKPFRCGFKPKRAAKKVSAPIRGIPCQEYWGKHRKKNRLHNINKQLLPQLVNLRKLRKNHHQNKNISKWITFRLIIIVSNAIKLLKKSSKYIWFASAGHKSILVQH